MHSKTQSSTTTNSPRPSGLRRFFNRMRRGPNARAAHQPAAQPQQAQRPHPHQAGAHGQPASQHPHPAKPHSHPAKPHPHQPRPHPHQTRPVHRPAPAPQAVHEPAAPAAAQHPATGAFAHLVPAIQRAVHEEGYTTPTPIQEQTIEHVLAGRDILGCAQTGTGKTAAFTLPLLQRLASADSTTVRGQPRALILAPTRELAMQIGDSIHAYGRHMKSKHTVIFGGVGQGPQVTALNRGVDILVATPGRLLDLLQQRHLRLDGIEIFVLDEADRMLDMGFIRDIRRIIAALPKKRQSLFFSATLSDEVVALAKTMVHDPVHVAIEPERPAVERIIQKVLFVEKSDKVKALVELLRGPQMTRVLVFTRMKHSANRLVADLADAGIHASAIHGNKSQGARTEAMSKFKSGHIAVLVATDLAARGIDVEGISHVINFDLPEDPETYVHRIGRTARAGADGDAVSLCCPEDREFVRDIERFIRAPIPVDLDHSRHSDRAMHATGAAARPPPRGGRGGHGGRGGSRGGNNSKQRQQDRQPRQAQRPPFRGTRSFGKITKRH